MIKIPVKLTRICMASESGPVIRSVLRQGEEVMVAEKDGQRQVPPRQVAQIFAR